MRKWKCSRCGVCCRLVFLISNELDRGDGVCKHLENNLCSIYNDRPEVCRVKDYSNIKDLNRACKQIRKLGGIVCQTPLHYQHY